VVDESIKGRVLHFELSCDLRAVRSFPLVRFIQHQGTLDGTVWRNFLDKGAL
jgi:hypothetical protein